MYFGQYNRKSGKTGGPAVVAREAASFFSTRSLAGGQFFFAFPEPLGPSRQPLQFFSTRSFGGFQFLFPVPLATLRQFFYRFLSQAGCLDIVTSSSGPLF